MFCNKNTGIAAALKHHHHPLKYSANSSSGQDGGKACLSASGKNMVQNPWANGNGPGIFSPKSSCLRQTKCFLNFTAVLSPQKPLDEASSKVVLDQTCRSEHMKVWSGA